MDQRSDSLPVASVVIRLALLGVLAALAFPTVASALELQIVNQSGKPDDHVYVTVYGAGAYDVPGTKNDVAQPLSEIPGGRLTINALISGRIYVSYGQGVSVQVPFDSPVRFDWAELNVAPSVSDVANLTAVDQFGIGMRLDTLDAQARMLETLSSSNSATIFKALGTIPGGASATIKDSHGHILRVLSPLHTSTYPSLGPYVRSFAGKRVTLRTAFYGGKFTTTHYSGKFAADGSITLAGTTNPAGQAPAKIEIPGSQLITDIYTGGNTPNDAEGAIYRDLLSGFSAGFWGGRYGNDAINFCSDPIENPVGSWCPSGFNKPAFGQARATLGAFPACERYAAVINALSDAYGNPYSDASKRVQIPLDQPGTGGRVTTLRLTVLADHGDARPVEAGNPNCGQARLRPDGAGAGGLRLVHNSSVRSGSAYVGRVSCPSACGLLKLEAAAAPAGARKARPVVGTASVMVGPGGPKLLRLKLTLTGRRLLARSRSGSLNLRVTALLSIRGRQVDRLDLPLRLRRAR